MTTATGKLSILDRFGRPLPKANGTPRPQLAQALQRVRRPAAGIQATYDAAQTNEDNQNYWSPADSYDADAANSKSVR